MLLYPNNAILSIFIASPEMVDISIVIGSANSMLTILSVGRVVWLVGRSVIISKKGGKLHFDAPIVAPPPPNDFLCTPLKEKI